MTKDNTGKKGRLIDCAIILISTLMLIGINTWFATCGPMEDGSFMTCHWAGQTVKAVSAVAAVLAVAHALLKDHKTKAAMVPGVLINLCMMEDMMCRAHTRPWTIILSVLLVAASAADLLFRYSAASEEAHGRG